MKLSRVVLAASVCLFAVTSAHAAGSHHFGIEGGASVPSGNFGDHASTGFNLGAQYQFMVNRYGVGAEIKYHGWGASDDANRAAEIENGAGSEVSFNAWQYDVFGVVTAPAAATQPYFKLGAGWYTPKKKLKIPTGDQDESDTKFGLVAGAGLSFDTRRSVKFGVGATYHRLKDSEKDFLSFSVRAMWPLKFGVRP